MPGVSARFCHAFLPDDAVRSNPGHQNDAPVSSAGVTSENGRFATVGESVTGHAAGIFVRMIDRTGTGAQSRIKLTILSSDAFPAEMAVQAVSSTFSAAQSQSGSAAEFSSHGSRSGVQAMDTVLRTGVSAVAGRWMCAVDLRAENLLSGSVCVPSTAAGRSGVFRAGRQWPDLVAAGSDLARGRLLQSMWKLSESDCAA